MLLPCAPAVCKEPGNKRRAPNVFFVVTRVMQVNASESSGMRRAVDVYTGPGGIIEAKRLLFFV